MYNSKHEDFRRRVERTRDAVDMVALVDDLGGAPRRSGSSWRARCPVHDGGDYNLSFDATTKVWCCFSHGCHKEHKGDPFGLVMGARSLPFVAALEWLEGHHGTVPYVPDESARAWTRAELGFQTDTDVQALQEELWSLTKPVMPTAEMEAYCARRGWAVEVVHTLGVRDWSPIMEPLVEVIKRDLDVAVRAGLMTCRDQTSELWLPLRRVVKAPLDGSGPPEYAGMVVPLWSADASAPVGLRWRVYRPHEDRRGPRKVYALHGPRDYQLLGLQPEGGAAGIGTSAAIGPVLVVVEGEPDFFAVEDALLGAASVIGLSSPSSALVDRSGAPRSFAKPLFEAMAESQRVLVLLHDVHGTERARELATVLDQRWGRGTLDQRLIVNLLPESHDAADLHLQGGLRPLLAELLPGLPLEGSINEG
jgi:hypothetical protein